MENIIGTWRFVSSISRDTTGRERPQPYGGQGMGRIVIGADGRMSVMMIDARKEIPAGEKREYSGYSGTYTFTGDKLVTHVDCAPDASRVGTDQPRGVRFENGRMILLPPAREVGGVMEQRELTWERVSEI